MCEDAVKGNIAMCEGCLAADRALSKLGRHTYLFNKLVASSDPDVDPFMCWECISVFNKICKFQQQVAKAQFILKYKHEFEPEYECLSTLNKSNRIDYYDLEIEHKENKIYECAVVKLEKIDLHINHYLNCNGDKNFDGDDKNYCNSDAVFFDSHKKHAVTIKDNKDDANDINYNNNDCKNEVNDGDQSCNNFGDNNDIENKEFDNTNDCKSEIYNCDQSFVDFGLNAIANKEIDNGGSSETKSKKKAKKIPRKCLRYNIVQGLKDRDKLYKEVKLDKQDLLDYMEKEQGANCESKLKINCELCLTMFSSEDGLRQHEKKSHSPTNKWTCDTCKKTFPTQSKLQCHSNSNTHSKYVCLPCGHVTHTRHQMYIHLTYNHKKIWECVKCKLRFPSSQRKEFHKHYRDMHKTFICDYCGEKFYSKPPIERHIRTKHTKLSCEKCNISFSKYQKMINHNRLEHMAPQSSENTYCVECDLQFPTELKYKNHLVSNSKHRPRVTERVQCPECDKVYSRKCFMTNHYNLVHLKKTNHFCEICSKYFLSGYRLREHKDITHAKIPPAKNKLCPHCGRGFSAMRILANHIRTHTGERPFSCEHCPAAFAKKSALKAHVKSKHQETLTQCNVESKLINK